MSVPTNLIPTLISGLPEYVGSSTLGYMPYILEGRTYKVQFSNIAAVGAVPSSRVIAAGTGLAGGGDLSENRVISIAAGGVGFDQLALSGVVAGTYGSGSAIPVLTVDSKGRVTSASTVALDVTGFVPTSRTITAGNGLIGGGSLANNITLAANFSATTPSALGIASAGTSVAVSRGDHVHPAVNLSDTTQTQGALPLGRGGTGDALSPVAGAVVYSTGTKFALTNPGLVGQVLVSNGTDEPQWQTIAGAGTVTSVNASGGTTGLSFSGGPITVSGTLTLGGTLGVANGGTGATDAATALTNLGAYPASNPAGYTSNVGTVTSLNLTAGTGISVSGGPITTSGSINVVNTAPDQIVALTGAGTTVVTGTYPNFTITSNDSTTGTVTSVNASGGTTGLSFTGGPITTSGTLTLAGTLAVANGGTGASVAGTARTNLGAAASGANTDITSIALTTGTVSATPTGGTDLVNKAYADSIASGINFHQSVRLATAVALPANTYNNGSSGVGATLTANANGALTVDGVAAVVGNRILVKNEVAQANNGVYTVTQVGDGSTPYILTRATDFDSSGSGVDQIDAGDFFLVTAGSTQSNTSWVQQTPLPITVGTTALVFTQFAAPVLYSAGTGLTLAGTVFSITNTGVSASTYGSASSVPVLAINAQGQVTSASTSSIAIAASQVTSGTFTVGRGGTGAATLTANGVLLGNGTSAISATAVGATGQVLVGNTGGAPSWAALSGIGVTSFRGGTTGLTPVSATTGAITLAGTLGVANGGTGATTLSSGYLVKGNGTSAVSASVVYDNGTNVGIGTTSPVYQLQVRGLGQDTAALTDAGNKGGSLYLQATANTSGSGGALLFGTTFGNLTPFAAIKGLVADGGTNTTGDLAFSTRNAVADTALTERMRITLAGNVGIGTSSPVTRLHAASTSDGEIFRVQRLGGTNLTLLRVNMSETNNTGTIDVTAAAGNPAMVFATTSSERMRIDSSGNVGIGTSTPASLGTLVVSKASSGTPIIALESQGSWNASISVNSSGNLIFSNNAATERMRIDSSGNVGIGTSSPVVKLDVNGNASFGGVLTTGNAISTEDARLELGGNRSAAGNAYIDFHALAGQDYNGRLIRFTGANGEFQLVNSGTGPLTFYTNNGERMRIDGSTGNVGIGTSTPAGPLQVVANTNSSLLIRGPIAYGTGPSIYAVNAANTAVAPMELAASGFFFNAGNVGVGNSNIAPKFSVTLTTGFSWGGGWGAGSAVFGGNGTASGAGSGGLGITYDDTDGGTIGPVIPGVAWKPLRLFSDTLQFYTNGATERMRIANGGNVGIGNSGPGYRLDVTAADTTSGLGYGMRLRANATANGGSMQFTDNAVTAQWAIITANTTEFRLTADGRPMTFYTGGAERMRITSSGFLLVGTTAPLGGNTSSEFKVTGAGSWPLTLNANDRGLLVRNSAAGSGFYAYFEYNGGTNNGSISWSGGTTAYNTTSDYRLKEIDGPITNSGAYIDALKPVEGWWKADGKRFIGFLAHQVQEVSQTPVVVGEKDGAEMQQMDYSAPELIANLIAEVQSLRARVAQLEGN